MSSSLQNDIASLSAFQADDSHVEIVPSFDYDHKLPLLSSTSTTKATSATVAGPFKAGIVTSVPLWLALMLQQRSLCRISSPTWLTVENLVDIIAWERREDTLFHDPKRLPHFYYEIAKRVCSSTSTADNNKAVSLLIQDLREVRVDKLRLKFQQTLNENADSLNLMMSVTGIAAVELTLLRPFVIQALNDQYFLNKRSLNQDKKNESEQGGGIIKHEEPAAAPRARVPIRRFRS